jgi:hypothetical protein
MERNETTTKEVQERIREVLRGCPEGRGMDKDSLYAACLLSAEIEYMQAALRLLQRGEITGCVNDEGEVMVQATGWS